MGTLRVYYTITITVLPYVLFLKFPNSSFPDTCQGVACSRPFSECEVVDRVAYCTCPSCYSSIDVTFTRELSLLCP